MNHHLYVLENQAAHLVAASALLAKAGETMLAAKVNERLLEVNQALASEQCRLHTLNERDAVDESCEAGQADRQRRPARADDRRRRALVRAARLESERVTPEQAKKQLRAMLKADAIAEAAKINPLKRKPR